MEQFENIKIIDQPKNLKLKLYRHQLASIYSMEEREKNKKIEYENEIVTANMGIFSDITGFGKTLSIIGLLCRNKMEWDLNEDFVHEKVLAIYGSGHIIRSRKSFYKKIDCNLIVVSQSIISQWNTESNQSTLKIYKITTKKMAEAVDPQNYNVILCIPTMYNILIQRFSTYCWKRVIYDEPCQKKIPAMRSVIAGFYWLITATPCMLLQTYRKSRSTHFLASIFGTYMDFGTFNSLIVKNPDEFVKLSYSLPTTSHVYHKCYQPIFNMIRGFVADQISEMIAAGNIEGAVKYLGGKKTDNIVELVKSKKIEQLETTKYKITIYTRRGEEDRVKYWKDRQEQIQDQIKELDNRFKNILTGDCNICLSSFEKPVMLTCCQNLFCGSCILEWLKTKSNCPLCRADIVKDMIFYIDEEKNKKCDKDAEVDSIKTKQDVILELIQKKKNGKFIIFSSYDESAVYIRTKLDQNNINFCEIQGRTEVRDKTIKEFKNGLVNVLFLNSNNNGAGINLQEATDIIMYHEMSTDVQTQIQGRANRIGRTFPLTVHHLI